MSARLADQALQGLGIQGVGHINCFLPIAKNNEPDTRILLQNLGSQLPGLQISIPFLPEAGANLVPVRWHQGMDWRPGILGTPTPALPDPVGYSEIDLVFVPLLAYDQRGYRAGYGGGYYDRFLATCRPDVAKVGLSFFEPVEALSDVWEGDIKLTACLTPEHIYTF